MEPPNAKNTTFTSPEAITSPLSTDDLAKAHNGALAGEASDTFHTDQVATVVGAHFIHDSFSAFVAPLLPVIQERLGTGYAATGGLSVFMQIPSLLNPFIGYMADKVSLRYFIILAPGLTATLVSSLGIFHNYVVLALLLFTAGISIAAFHAPAPAMVARLSGRRVGTGMSLFMAGGELGRTLGPLLVVTGIGWWGAEGIWRLAIIGWFCSAILYFRLRNISASPVAKTSGSLREIWPRVWRFFLIIIWIGLAKAFLSVAVTTYLPIFMRDVHNTNLWLAGVSLSILEGAGVAGALLTGTLSDRLGRHRILLIVLAIAPLFLIAFLYAPGWLVFPLLIGLGLTVISPTPVLLALIQDHFPENRAMTNGIYLTINFLMRALAIWVVGALADQYGLGTAYLWSGIAAMLSVPGVFFLPQKP
jgi:FSR family fosmidomycin resistance protein-like MFS transporter